MAASRPALLLFTRQKDLEGALDRTGAGAREALAAVRPGLGSLEVRVPPHKSAAVLRLILTVARLPRTLQFDVLSAEAALPLFGDRLGCVAQAYDMAVPHGIARDRYFDCLAAFASGKRQLVADKGAPINRIAHLRRHRHGRRRDHGTGKHAGPYSSPLH